MQEMIHGAGILEEFSNHVGGLHKQSLESSSFDNGGEAPTRAVTDSSLESSIHVSDENKLRVAETEGVKIELLSQASTFSVPMHSLDSSEVHLTLTTLGSGNLTEEARQKPQSSLAALVQATESRCKTLTNGFHCKRSDLPPRISEDDDSLEDDEGDDSGDEHSSSEEDSIPAKPPQESSSIDVPGQFFQWFVKHHRRCDGVVLKLKTVYDNFKNTNLWLALPKRLKFTYVRLCELFEQHATLGVDYRARLQRSLGFLRDVLVGWEFQETPVGCGPIEMQDMISALLQLSEPTDSDTSASDPATTMLTLITVAEGESDVIKPRKKTRSENLVYQRWNEDRKVKKGLTRTSRSNSHSPVTRKSTSSSSETLSSPSCMSDFKFTSSSVPEALPVEVMEILEEAQLGLVVQKWRKDRKERGVYWVYDRDSKYKFDTIVGTASLCAASIEHILFGPKRTLSGVELPVSPTRKRVGSIDEPSSPSMVRRSVSMTDLKQTLVVDTKTISKEGDNVITISRRGLKSGSFGVNSHPVSPLACDSLNASGDLHPYSKSGRRTKLENASEPLPDAVSKLLCQAQLTPEAQGWHEDSHSKGTYWLRKLEGRYKVNTKAGSVWYWPPHSRKHNVVFQISREEPSSISRDIFSNGSLISPSLCSKLTCTSSISSDTKRLIASAESDTLSNPPPRKKVQVPENSSDNGPKKTRAEHRRKGAKSETVVEDHVLAVESIHVTNDTKNIHVKSDPVDELRRPQLVLSGNSSLPQRKRVSRRTKSLDINNGSPSELLNGSPKEPSSGHSPKRRIAHKRNDQSSDAAEILSNSASTAHDSSVVKPESPIAADFPIQAGIQRWSSRLHGGLVEFHTELPRRVKQRKVSRSTTTSPEIGGSLVPPEETSGPAASPEDVQVSSDSCSGPLQIEPIDDKNCAGGAVRVQDGQSILSDCVDGQSNLSGHTISGSGITATAIESSSYVNLKNPSQQPNADGIVITAPVTIEGLIEQKGSAMSQVSKDLPPILDSMPSTKKFTDVDSLSVMASAVANINLPLVIDPVLSELKSTTDSTTATDDSTATHTATRSLNININQERTPLAAFDSFMGAACEQLTQVAVGKELTTDPGISHETYAVKAPVPAANSPSLPVVGTPSMLATPNPVVQAAPTLSQSPSNVELPSTLFLSPLEQAASLNNSTQDILSKTPNIVMGDACQSVLPVEMHPDEHLTESPVLVDYSSSSSHDALFSCPVAETVSVQTSDSPSQNVSYLVAEEPSLILAPLQVIDLPNLLPENISSSLVEIPSVLTAPASETKLPPNIIQASSTLAVPSSLQSSGISFLKTSLPVIALEQVNLSQNISASLSDVSPNQNTSPSLVEIPTVSAVSPPPVTDLPNSLSQNISLLVEAPVLAVPSPKTPERLLLRETFPGEIFDVPSPRVEIIDLPNSLVPQDDSALLVYSSGAASEVDNMQLDSTGTSQIFKPTFEEDLYHEHIEEEDASFVERHIDQSGSTDSSVWHATSEPLQDNCPVGDETAPDRSENSSMSTSQMLDGRRRRRRTRPVVLTAPSWMVKNTNDSEAQQDFAGAEIEAIFDVLEQTHTQRDNSKVPSKTNPRPELEQSAQNHKVDESLSPRAVRKISASVEANTGNRRHPPLTKVRSTRSTRSEHGDLVPKETSIQNLHKPARAVPPSSYVCKLCNVAGHWMEGCSRYVCANCKRQGHSTITCPDRVVVDNKSRDAIETLRNTFRHDDGNLRVQSSWAAAKHRHERAETQRDHGQSRSANISSDGCTPIGVRPLHSHGAHSKPRVSSLELDRMSFEKKPKSVSRSRDEPRILSAVRHSMEKSAIRPKDEPRTYPSDHDARERGRSSSSSREKPASRFNDEVRAKYDARGQSIGGFKNEPRAPAANNYDARGLFTTRSASRPRDETRVRASNYDSRVPTFDKLSSSRDVHSNPGTRASDKSTTGFKECRAQSSTYDRGAALDTPANCSKMESRRPALDQTGGRCEPRIHSNHDTRGFGSERTSSGGKDESRAQPSTFDARIPTLDRKRSRSLSGSEISSSRVDPKRLQGTNHDRNSMQRRSIGDNLEDGRRNEDASRYTSGSFQRGTDIRDSNASARQQILSQRSSHADSNFQSIPLKRTYSDRGIPGHK